MEARQVKAGKTFLSPTDYFVEISTNDGAVEICLPKISTVLDTFKKIGTTFQPIRFLDVSSTENDNKITFTAMDDDLIDGNKSRLIDSRYSSGVFSLISKDRWFLNLNEVIRYINNGGGVKGG